MHPKIVGINKRDSSNNVTVSDIPKDRWVDKFVPVPFRPYVRLARLDRPIGTWLVLFPCWWSLSLATTNWTPEYFFNNTLGLFVLFGIGALVMRGAGCTFNDIIDRNFDANIARTADRPIPSGAVSVKSAVAFMGILSLLGLIIILQFNMFAITLAILSLGLLFAYPFMKRITYWPQLVLGLAFNWGALLGWASIKGELQIPAFVLYLAGIFWTLGYDTIYAHQDKEDDLIVGVKSLALKLGDNTQMWLMGFYTISILLFGASGYLADLGWVFYLFMLALTYHLFWQVIKLRTTDPMDCLAKFKSNRLFGWLMLGGIIFGHVI